MSTTVRKSRGRKSKDREQSAQEARARARQLNEEARNAWEFLDGMIEDVFDKAFELEMTWYQLASNANLGHKTVERLGNKVTMLPRLETFRKLALAVGMEVRVIDEALHVFESQPSAVGRQGQRRGQSRTQSGRLRATA